MPTPALSLVVLLAFASPQEPSGFALVERTRDAYHALAAYADSGEIAVESAGGAETRFRFETRYRPGAASYLLERLGDESPDLLERPAVWAVWSDSTGAFLYDGDHGTYRRVASAASGLTELLGDDRRTAALVILELLASDNGGPLATPLAAGFEGSTDCDGRRCRTLDATFDGVAGSLRLALDGDTHLIRRLEITLDPIDTLIASDDVAAALRDAKKRSRHDQATRIVVSYQPAADMAAVAAEPWVPPSTATPAQPAPADEAAAIASTGAAPASPSASDRSDRPPGRVFGEEIEVRLSTVTVRAIDSSGRVIPDLGAADFRVRVGGEPAEIQSVDWISPGSERFSSEELAELARSGITVPSTGRLIVLFVQTDLHPTRTPGHLRLRPEIRKLLATLHPEDEVAVVSFDSHLKLRLDFTRDLESVDEAVWRGIRTGREDEIAPGRFPSLARHFDFDAARRAASPEKALQVVGDALLPLPGEKIMVFAGWGLGDYFGGHVSMTPDYYDAREALARAHVTVFVLDVTQADYHSLEIGLETIAEDTGGTYEKTFRQPSQMTRRLAHALEGYYEIGFALPETIDRRGKVSVELVGRRGEVLLRPTRASG